MRVHNKARSYQTEHLCSGFMGEPAGHWKASAKGSKLLTTTLTRYLFGEWLSMIQLRKETVFEVASHQVWPKKVRVQQ